MKPVALSLEDFGDPTRRRPSEIERAHAAELARVRGEAHAAGYAAGFAEALAQAETEDRAAVADLLERIGDLELGAADARRTALDALAPVLAAIARVAAPRAAAAGLADEIVAAVGERLAAAPDARLAVRAPEARFDALRAALGDAAQVRADPALEGARAELDWTGGGAVFDADAALAAALDAIERHFAPAEAGGVEERMRDAG